MALPLSESKKRWRRAYLTIHISKTLLSVARKNNEIVPGPEEVCINLGSELTDHTPFLGLDHSQLADIIHNKNLTLLLRFDGVKGFAKTLGTDLDYGLEGHDLNIRRTLFGSNTYKKPSSKSLFYLMLEAFTDFTILILFGCAALSLGFGIKQHGLKDGWYEAGSILLAIFAVVAVSTVSNFGDDEQFVSLSSMKNDITIHVIRGGIRQKIATSDIVVGDIVVLNIGDRIPADGLFVDGKSLVVNEWNMTGESELVDINEVSNPFLISGAKVAYGQCRMLVLSVGMNTALGKMMSSSRDDNNKQRTFRVTCVLAFVFLVLLVSLIRYFTQHTEHKTEDDVQRTRLTEILDSVGRIFSRVVTILVVAIPQHLSLVVTLTFSYSMKRMTCSATVECSEKPVNDTYGCRFTDEFTEVCGTGEEECEEVLKACDEERLQKVDKIQMVEKSSHFDKLLMVKRLKQKGRAVAITGEGSAHIEANISVEIQGFDGVTQSSSDMNISDEDDTAVLMLGRRLFNEIQQFVQFQFTVNTAIILCNVISRVTSGAILLTAVQVLWVNLIMDTLGALAHATKPPSKELQILNKPCVVTGKIKAHVEKFMLKYVFGLGFLQITVLLTCHFKGSELFNVEERVKHTITFITFVVCQVFNEFCSRKLKKRNIFEGLHKSRLFVGITGVTIILEIAQMVKRLENFSETNGVQWGVCIAVAALSWWYLKEDAWISENDFFATTVKSMKKRSGKNEWLVSESVKHAIECLESGDEHVLHVFHQAGYRLCRVGVGLQTTPSCFDLDTHSELKQVVDALESAGAFDHMEIQYNAADNE